MNSLSALEELAASLREINFFMLRYETEYTPCTGITAVTRQECRHFTDGVMIAPWCAQMTRAQEARKKNQVVDTGIVFTIAGKDCNVYRSSGEGRILFLDVQGCFQGKVTPYDVSDEELKRDTLYFGLAVRELLKRVEETSSEWREAPKKESRPFVWGADWESVPALLLVRQGHTTALTLHNTFDKCLAEEAKEPAFGEAYGALRDKWPEPRDGGIHKTALEVGIGAADVVTAVNRGFAYGIGHEQLQTKIMVKHLSEELRMKVVGVDNGRFNDFDKGLENLLDQFTPNFEVGCRALFDMKREKRAQLFELLGRQDSGHVVVVTMGRRTAQKQHELLLECVRQLLTEDPRFPILAIFATTAGDPSSATRLEPVCELAGRFPANVVPLSGRISFYQMLMAAADYNCMPSLYEPHGGAFEGLVVPVARAVDGLAAQICPWNPSTAARKLADLYHGSEEHASGFLFREKEDLYSVDELRALLTESPAPANGLFNAMRDALTETLRAAIDLRLNHQTDYARLVEAALRKQKSQEWSLNLQAMLSLVKKARARASE